MKCYDVGKMYICMGRGREREGEKAGRKRRGRRDKMLTAAEPGVKACQCLLCCSGSFPVGFNFSKIRKRKDAI